MEKTRDFMQGHRQDGSANSSCFWNYFGAGVDFLVSRDGIVEKIIIHGNWPGSPDFTRWRRCFWSVDGTDVDHCTKVCMRSTNESLNKCRICWGFLMDRRLSRLERESGVVAFITWIA
jgi:hypothetical protein